MRFSEGFWPDLLFTAGLTGKFLISFTAAPHGFNALTPFANAKQRIGRVDYSCSSGFPLVPAAVTTKKS